jgi:hypothetical protein
MCNGWIFKSMYDIILARAFVNEEQIDLYKRLVLAFWTEEVD